MGWPLIKKKKKQKLDFNLILRYNVNGTGQILENAQAGERVLTPSWRVVSLDASNIKFDLHLKASPIEG